MSGAAAQGAAASDRFAQAHAALRADTGIQFTLQPAPPPPRPPAWIKRVFEWLGDALRPLGRFFGWLDGLLPSAPYARIFLWSVLAVVVAALLWAVWQRFRYGEWRLPRRRSARAADVAPEAEDWTPDAAPAREWLREADAMAAQGRFAEAVHHLLRRSVDDIARRRPRLVRPALTSRELGVADAIPPAARTLFAGIAALVERSLFGGRPVDAADWTGARARYAEFALPGAWRG